MSQTLHTEAEDTLRRLSSTLLEKRDSSGLWKGRLSSSALSTATALFCLELEKDNPHAELSRQARQWLAQTQNKDGGWGDTPESPSHFPTALLVLCALEYKHSPDACTFQARDWVTKKCGGLEADQVIGYLLNFYGKDKTFSIPILSMCALSGFFGENPKLWKSVPSLPFELAALPHSFFKFLGLPVVSYALPALIALGQLKHHKAPSSFLPIRYWRNLCVKKTLRVLEEIQPPDGGYLEATPLTCFVQMSLLAMGKAQSATSKKCLSFILSMARPNGSWPIDIDLSQWVSSLSLRALATKKKSLFNDKENKNILDLYKKHQWKVMHPYTHSPSGGWAWTHSEGGVPDGDDTSAALIVLKEYGLEDSDILSHATNGCRWLLDLQNRNGGFPTFCKGWGHLPFDQSCPDISAHAFLALSLWAGHLPSLDQAISRSLHRSIQYLKKTQRADGSWLPLWFGNQEHPKGHNPILGTARVLDLLCCAPPEKITIYSGTLANAYHWLVRQQNNEGGFAVHPQARPTLEDSALATKALIAFEKVFPQDHRHKKKSQLPIAKAISWLLKNTPPQQEIKPSPIGLYFSSLWYDEELYPLIFSISALMSFLEGEKES